MSNITLNINSKPYGLNEEQALIRAVGSAIAASDFFNFSYRDVELAVSSVENYDGTTTLSETFAMIDSHATRLGIIWTIDEENVLRVSY